MSNNYAGKFVSAETAVKAVQPGDWVDYGFVPLREVLII